MCLTDLLQKNSERFFDVYLQDASSPPPSLYEILLLLYVLSSASDALLEYILYIFC